MRMIPAIDIGECTDCGSCLEVCPEVFRRNPGTECMEVLDLPEYPEKCVQEGITVCPADCITWEQT
ncbi:MAG: ferredoxin [Deltaproteobacteria bacterium]|nr:ferredoxin [Deltaproteobacteria bacterium]